MDLDQLLPAAEQHGNGHGDDAVLTQAAAQLPTPAAIQHPPYSYLTGSRDLDERVFLGPTGGLSGGVVGISAAGDVGLVLSLQVIAQHLNAKAAATARIVTTHPVAHVVRLLRGVLAAGVVMDKAAQSSVLRRVLISRIYAPDDLWAVLEDLESAVPFRRLWSTSLADGGSRTDKGSGGHATDDKPQLAPAGLHGSDGTDSRVSIIVITEIDHHFKWMSLQGPRGLRLHELYGQLMRRLRALASATFVSTSSHPLVLVLNSTAVQKSWGEPAGVPAGGVDGEAAGGITDEVRDSDGDEDKSNPTTADDNESYEAAIALLRLQKSHLLDATAEQRADIVRLCYLEISKKQNRAPLYKRLIDYMCSLHVCFTRAWPHADSFLREEHNRYSGQNTALGADLWVVTVENDEAEIFDSDHERFGLIQFSDGALRDAFPI